ncbi:hypothetical protein CYPRO_1329 [Cyclonatronum proteinivorum]|uniref:Uncharacterized protein n=1 Tax=Cyclonatronum proteinivorum TaxID=1457365 RepID=A0A345UJD4_9BACT|nr:hypothetical protein [Cyclonatronum proteinivorum]AXJ00586.1 hypothetical protein CYPRO_1329 [Cyclonatronum proteinivorum]
MSKIHYFQRYSTLENTVTNNTLQLLARIYSYSPVLASKLLSDITDESVDIGLEITQQRQANKSVPDGTIMQRSFKIILESKVTAPADVHQLLRHAEGFGNEEQKILLLLTVQELGKSTMDEIANSIKNKAKDVIFRNVTYEKICNAVQDLFQPHENEMNDLVDDYVEYCNDTGLFDQSSYLMRIVPCGNSLDLNKKYGIYFQPADRGYTKHSYIGIYAQKTVQCLWEIDAVFDITYDGTTIEKTHVQGTVTDAYDDKIIEVIAEAKKMCGYDVQRGYRFFCGKEAVPTNYVKVSSGGIQGARLTNLKNIVGAFDTANELARKLSEKTWE